MDRFSFESLRILPKPILFGIITGMGLALFAKFALPPLRSIVDAGWPFATTAEYLGAGIALMPAPGGFIVFLFYRYLAYRNDRSGNP